MVSLRHNISFLILLFIAVLALSFACNCSPPRPSPDPHNPQKHPVKLPQPPMKWPTIKPSTHKPPPVVTSPTPCPPPTPTSPVVTPPTPDPHVVTPPIPIPPEPETCPIDTLKLGACVDMLGGCIHMGVGKIQAKETCCPVLGGLFSMDAAICLCITIEAKFLNIDLIIPIAIEILLDCGRPPPPGFKCPI
ncbi:unnamed protein product [Eruca vesicaria subsp. sativa]|uniref:Hydrophobic seed protein domain-containing protein n=1 Tax=Eruca vesicaria subsp. sativa TaxID=29727 RepID=A0ABC8LIN2_ERUVS|nr:unnamed protein product [Eruca vesicaria subsp. sativa]